jgi:hypothetical protein
MEPRVTQWVPGTAYPFRASDLIPVFVGFSLSYFVYNCLSFLRFLFGSYIAYPSNTDSDYDKRNISVVISYKWCLVIN